MNKVVITGFNITCPKGKIKGFRVHREDNTTDEFYQLLKSLYKGDPNNITINYKSKI